LWSYDKNIKNEGCPASKSPFQLSAKVQCAVDQFRKVLAVTVLTSIKKISPGTGGGKWLGKHPTQVRMKVGGRVGWYYAA